MAEGMMRHLFGDNYVVYSAGTHPQGINPRAVIVMAELGIDIANQASQSVQEFQTFEFNNVVTVCDNAKEACPVFWNTETLVHWSFEDPADATGSEEEILSHFRRIRDQIYQKISGHFTEVLSGITLTVR